MFIAISVDILVNLHIAILLLSILIGFIDMSKCSQLILKIVYGLDDRGPRVRFSAEAGNFSLHHCVQNGSGAHPASYPMGTSGSFPGGKAAGT
jgi:hypothetical protein